MIILLVAMEGLWSCKWCMSDVCMMELLYFEYDGDIPFITIYCRYQFNNNFNVINSTFHDNSAGGDGGAIYL